VTAIEGSKRARVQGDDGWDLCKTPGCWQGRYRKAMPPGSISWEEHMEAWREYAEHYPGQSAERMAERGGFGHYELRLFLKREPRTFVIHPSCAARWARVPGPEYGCGFDWDDK
jgi:hypothetical protein